MRPITPESLSICWSSNSFSSASSNFPFHPIVKCLTFGSTCKLKIQCIGNGFRNIQNCPGSFQDTFINLSSISHHQSFQTYLATKQISIMETLEIKKNRFANKCPASDLIHMILAKWPGQAISVSLPPMNPSHQWEKHMCFATLESGAKVTIWSDVGLPRLLDENARLHLQCVLPLVPMMHHRTATVTYLMVSTLSCSKQL